MAQEAPIKHTAGGEIPDTSTAAEVSRRLEADLSVVRDPMVLRMLAPLALIGAGFVVFLVWKRGR